MGYTRARVQMAFLTGERESEALTPAETAANIAEDAGDAFRTVWFVTSALAKAVRTAMAPAVGEEAAAYAQQTEAE